MALIMSPATLRGALDTKIIFPRSINACGCMYVFEKDVGGHTLYLGHIFEHFLSAVLVLLLLPTGCLMFSVHNIT